MVEGPATVDIDITSPSANALLVIICAALAGYNALELILLIFTTFAVYRGLYFWSLLVATTAILPYAIGLCMFYFEWTYKLAGYIINNVGWWFMITGQSMVLYSRLGIVLGRGYERTLKFVKWMIIIDAAVFCTMSTVIVFGRYYAPNQAPFTHGYRYVEKIQMTAFCIQEFIISGIYVWKTVDILRTGTRKRNSRLMWQLFIINVLIIIIDIALLALEYRNLFIPEVSFKALAYSIKLKLEFAILSKLVGISHTDGRRTSIFFGNTTNDNHESKASEAGEDAQYATCSVSAASRPNWASDTEKAQRPVPEMANGTVKGGRGDQEVSIKTAFDDGAVEHVESVDLMYAKAMKTVSR